MRSTNKNCVGGQTCVHQPEDEDGSGGDDAVPETRDVEDEGKGRTDGLEVKQAHNWSAKHFSGGLHHF